MKIWNKLKNIFSAKESVVFGKVVNNRSMGSMGIVTIESTYPEVSTTSVFYKKSPEHFIETLRAGEYTLLLTRKYVHKYNIDIRLEGIKCTIITPAGKDPSGREVFHIPVSGNWLATDLVKKGLIKHTAIIY